MRLRLSTVLVPLVLGLLALPAACTYENNEDLLGNAPPRPDCDTLVAITYSGQIAPLLQQRCMSCHNNLQPSGNFSVETPAQVQSKARTGLLLGVVSHAPGYDPMPQGAPKLSDCDVAKIRKWVQAGAPNN